MFYVWKRPVNLFAVNHEFAFHTWVTNYESVTETPPSPKEGCYWHCLGGNYITDPLPHNVKLVLETDGGCGEMASCICEPNRYVKNPFGATDAGIRFIRDGVCHQITNRILAAAKAFIPLSSMPDYVWTVFLYGLYGDKNDISQKNWHEIKERCGVTMTHNDEHLIKEQFDKHDVEDPTELLRIRSRFHEKQNKLAIELEAGRISYKTFERLQCQAISDLRTSMKKVLGDDKTQAIFGDQFDPSVYAICPHPLQSVRESLSLTREKLAEKVSAIDERFNASFFEAIESFREKLDAIDALKLSQYFDISFAELLPQSRPSIGPVLGENASTAPKVIQVGKSNFDDARLEIGDFLDKFDSSIADEMLTCWRSSTRNEFLGRVSELVDHLSEFEKVYCKAVVHTCLLQDHNGALPYLDQALKSSSDQSHDKQSDVFYLLGRNLWYRKSDLPRSAKLLWQAHDVCQRQDYANKSQYYARKAQCLIYLARIKLHAPTLVRQGPDELLQEAGELAAFAERDDVLLLCKHAWIVRHRHARQNDRGLEVAKEALDTYGESSRNRRLINSIRAGYGIALRGKKDETSRDLALEQYNIGTKTESGDSATGMFWYLKADIFADKMQNAILQGRAQKSSQLFEAAESWRTKAVAACHESIKRLELVGDPATLAMVHKRLAFFDNALAIPHHDVDESLAIDEYATRYQQLTSMLLGDEYNEFPPDKSIADLQKVVDLYFRSVNISDSTVAGEDLNANNLVPDGALLCLPIHVLSDLLLLFYVRNGDQLSNVGWYSLPGYNKQDGLKALLRAWLDDSSTADGFLRAGDAVWSSLTGQVTPIRHLRKKFATDGVEDVVVLAPESTESWAIPYEKLPLQLSPGNAYSQLADIAKRSIIYANSTRKIDIECSLRIDNATILATNQVLAKNVSVHDKVDKTAADLDFHSISVEELPSVDKPEALVLIAHAEADLFNALRQMNLSNTKVFVLLMCAALKEQSVRGPISDNITFDVSSSLSKDSVLVVPRVMVSVDEAVRFVRALDQKSAEGKSVATSVLEIIRESDAPFHTPWVVLS